MEPSQTFAMDTRQALLTTVQHVFQYPTKHIKTRVKVVSLFLKNGGLWNEWKKACKS